MAKEITISNSSGSYYELTYRMPGEITQILNVVVIAYALNQKVSFPNDAYYNEFKLQNAHYFEGATPILLEGKVGASKMEKINEKVNEEIRAKIDGEMKSFDDSLISASEEYAGKAIEIVTEKVDKHGRTDTHKRKSRK